MAIRSALKRGISLGAFTIALAPLAQPLAAQEASVEPGDQTAAEDEAGEDQGIIVTGFRESLETAVNLKRNAPVIAESFSAEDIGKLPDVSIASMTSTSVAVTCATAGALISAPPASTVSSNAPRSFRRFIAPTGRVRRTFQRAV